MPSVFPTSIRIPKVLKERLLRYAREEKRPLAVQIIYVLEQWVKWRETQQEKKP